MTYIDVLLLLLCRCCHCHQVKKCAYKRYYSVPFIDDVVNSSERKNGIKMKSIFAISYKNICYHSRTWMSTSTVAKKTRFAYICVRLWSMPNRLIKWAYTCSCRLRFSLVMLLFTWGLFSVMCCLNQGKFYKLSPFFVTFIIVIKIRLTETPFQTTNFSSISSSNQSFSPSSNSVPNLWSSYIDTSINNNNKNFLIYQKKRNSCTSKVFFVHV